MVLIRQQPLTQQDLEDPRLLALQQEDKVGADLEFEQPSTATTSYKLANYFGRLMLTRERPLILIALLAVLGGLIVLIGPYRSTIAAFDKTAKQATLTKPRWFFRSHKEIYPFQAITEVRVERERTTRRRGRNFGVNLIISHSDGVPLTRNYVHYKTVFPLSEALRYDYETAREVADGIKLFMADPQYSQSSQGVKS